MISFGKNFSIEAIVFYNSNKGNAGFNMLTIRGIVIPLDWDKKGDVVPIAVSTYDEDEDFIWGQERLIQEVKHHIGGIIATVVIRQFESSLEKIVALSFFSR